MKSTMTSTDPIADMLTRIRNAISVRKIEISLPHSKTKEVVAQILADNYFIDSVRVEGEGISKLLTLILHAEGENARITEIVRMSKPGRRLYSKSDDIPTVKRGRGLIVISTSQGVMSGSEARSQRLGGELICKVY